MPEQYYQLTLADAIAKYKRHDLTAKGLVHFYILIKCKPGWKVRLEHQKVCKELGIKKSAFYDAISRLRSEGYLDEEIFCLSEYSDTERQIRDRMKAELGGQVEVTTAVGRIDLLTSNDVIEIKNIDDWKEALGKILAYSTFFPEHGKRIHLFGRPDLTKLALAQTSCFEFGVTVTFETEEVG